MPNGAPLICGFQNNTASLETRLVRSGGILLSAFDVENGAGGGILGRGQSASTHPPGPKTPFGVWGDSGTGIGVYGASDGGPGVQGASTNASGVDGTSNTGPGVRGACLRNPNAPRTGFGPGVLGESTEGVGVFGESINEAGVEGRSGLSSGVRGEFRGPETPGVAGVYGRSTDGTAVVGQSDNSTGVFGNSNQGSGVFGRSNQAAGVFGEYTGTYNPRQGLPRAAGVFGESVDGIGVVGQSDNSRGVLAFGRIGVHAITSSHAAGLFQGNVEATGHIFGNGKSFRIDHPLDPANKYLHHSAVESPDMKNVYDGVAPLDQDGQTVVSLPEYFAALNKDFRYQLTAIGEAGPNLHIAEEISNNQFKIAGGEPEMEVSWQITGIRKDKAAEANRVPVEQEKPAEERGLYWHPEAHGQPEERGVLQARYGEPRLHAEEQKQQIVEHKRRLEAQRGQLEVLEPAPNPPSVT